MKIIIIPVRMESIRFPGKPLHLIAGKTLLERTYNLACSTEADCVYVATDSKVVKEFCIEKNWRVVENDIYCETGTHRCANALEHIGNEIEQVINLQVDEPMLNPNDINEFFYNPPLGLSVHTLVCQNGSSEQYVRA